MMKLIVGLLVILVTAWPASAVAFLSHSRSIEAVADVSGPLSHTWSTSAAGFWSELAFADQFIGGAGTATANVWQSSDIYEAGIGMSGALSAAATSSFPEFSAGSASATSRLSATFLVVTPTHYASTLSTTGDTETLFAFRPTGSGGSFLAKGSGVLSPGNYEISITFTLAAASGEALEGNYAYNLSFVPEPSTTFLILIAAPLFAWRRVPHSV